MRTIEEGINFLKKVVEESGYEPAYEFDELSEKAKERVLRECERYLKLEFKESEEILNDLEIHMYDEARCAVYDINGYFIELM